MSGHAYPVALSSFESDGALAETNDCSFSSVTSSTLALMLQACCTLKIIDAADSFNAPASALHMASAGCAMESVLTMFRQFEFWHEPIRDCKNDWISLAVIAFAS